MFAIKAFCAAFTGKNAHQFQAVRHEAAVMCEADTPCYKSAGPQRADSTIAPVP